MIPSHSKVPCQQVIPRRGSRVPLASLLAGIRLANSLHVAVPLFINGSQVTITRAKSKKSGARGDSRVCHCFPYHIVKLTAIKY